MFAALKLAKRVSELEETMLKLTRLVESHDLDWEDMRARCKRLLDRTEKAARVLQSPPEVDQDTPLVPSEGDGTKMTVALSPSQMRLQQQILRSRKVAG